MYPPAPGRTGKGGPTVLLVVGQARRGITSPKVQQGRPVRDGNFLHLSDKDGVISGCMGLHDGTVQARQRAGNNRGTTFHLTVMNGEAAGGIRITLWVGEELGERLLLFPEDADAEASALAHVKVGFGQVINANQHQRRGRSDTEQKELAVMPCTSPAAVLTVTTVMPEAKRPRAARNSCGVTEVDSLMGGIR